LRSRSDSSNLPGIVVDLGALPFDSISGCVVDQVLGADLFICPVAVHLWLFRCCHC
jgi:hypothetical protein